MAAIIILCVLITIIIILGKKDKTVQQWIAQLRNRTGKPKNNSNTDGQASSAPETGGAWTDEQVKQILKQEPKRGCASAGWFLLILIILIVGATLPFHYVFSNGSLADVFPKDNLTFSNTFITQQDIDDLIKRYNDAGLIDKLSMRQDPLYKELMEHGIIREDNKNTENQQNDNDNSDNSSNYDNTQNSQSASSDNTPSTTAGNTTNATNANSANSATTDDEGMTAQQITEKFFNAVQNEDYETAWEMSDNWRWRPQDGSTDNAQWFHAEVFPSPIQFVSDNFLYENDSETAIEVEYYVIDNSNNSKYYHKQKVILNKENAGGSNVWKVVRILDM